MTDLVPVNPDLFASLDPPRLLGSRCARCQTVTFPTARSCPRCSGDGMAPYELAGHGTVWTWTVQSFAPKAPYVLPSGGFVAFPVGYVDLGDVIVESHLLADADQLEIGTPVRLVLEQVQTADGGRAVTYAFAPHADAA